MERRSSLRKPIYHDAMLRLEGGATRSCIIADYCSEGMFIKYSQSASNAIKADINSGEGRTFTLIFKGHEKQQFEIVAEPVNLMNGAAGVRFIGQYDAAVQSLLALGAKNVRQSTPKEDLDHIVHESIDCIQQFTAPLLTDFYPVLVAEIKASAVKASTDQLANATMEVANTIERDQQQQLRRFQKTLKDPIGLLNQEANEGPDVTGRLAMIDKGEFEDWLITRVLVTKAETMYRALLLPLKMRLDAIGLADKKHHQCPFGPSLLVSALQSALGRMTIDNTVEKLIFRTFETQVVSQLEPLYEALNKLLIRNNILPDLDLSKMIAKTPEPLSGMGDRDRATGKPEEDKSPESEQDRSRADHAEPETQPRFTYGGNLSQSPASAQQHSVTNSTPPFSLSETQIPSAPVAGDVREGYTPAQGSAESAYQDVVGLVRSLRTDENAHANGVQTTEGDIPTRENYSAVELGERLSAMQLSSIADTEKREDRLSLLDRVQDDLRQEGASDKEIHEDQQVAIDVVDRFFASLSKNPRLTHETKQHLFNLEIPVLKVLLKDDRFFDDRNSSVRAVMNRIAQLGAKGTRLSPSGQKRVETLVRKIVEEFENDTVIFDHALAELNDLVDRQNTLYVKNVERVAAAAEGVHQVEQAKLAVAQALNKRLGSRSVPKAVLTLIDKGWQDLLNRIHIKYGENSGEWRSHLAVIDNLISYSDDPDSHPLNMQELLPKIQAGLKQVTGSGEPSTEVRDELKDLIKSSPDGAQRLVAPVLREVPENEDDIARKNARKSQALKHWIIRAKSMQVGFWVQFNRTGEETQYMRLVWIAKGYSKFVFVNHQGMKVVELGLFKFANYLKDQIVIPDPNYEIPIVNQSLDDMVKDVYDKLAYESSHDKATGLAKKGEFCRQVRALMKSGNKTASCSLLYIRFDSMTGEIETRVPADFAREVAAALSSISVEQSLIGRISETDFVMFSVNDGLDMVNVRCGELLMSLCQRQDDIEKRLIVVLGESRAHLGFNNPESMINHALRPIVEGQHATTSDGQETAARNSQSAIDSETGELSENSTAVEVCDSQSVQIEVLESPENAADALEQHKLEIYCQKAMSLADDSVHEEQYELLCSVPGSGISYEPDSEKMARALDQWWIDQLLLNHKNQNPVWDSIDFMRVQLSGYAFQDDTFKDYLLLLAESGAVDAGRIWFDIYDCAVIENIHAAADMMKHLMIKGYRFCLDHFGSSRSPFALLKVLPVDMIKIDESFMESLNQDESNGTAAGSIVELAHYLSKEVLATSVDSAICLQRMKQLGVDYVQGSTISDYERLEAGTP